MLKKKKNHHGASFYHVFADCCKQSAKLAALWDVKGKELKRWRDGAT